MKFGIIGGGSWATAIAKMLTDNEHSINWWFRNNKVIDHIRRRKHNPHYLSTAYFNTGLLAMDTDLAAVVEKSDALIICVPSSYLLEPLKTLPANAFNGKKIISAVKGLIPGSNQLLNEYLA